jgi:hypothetical protein
MTDDLVKRLRQPIIHTVQIKELAEILRYEAADHIEALEAALRKCHTALEVAFDYDGDDVFGMMHNDAVDASIEAERLLGIKP